MKRAISDPARFASVAAGRGRWLVGLSVAACALAQAAEPVPLRLIGINDFHGNLEPPSLSLYVADPQNPAGKPLRVTVGGATALAGLVKSLRAGAPNSLMVSAGDLIGAAPLVSTLFKHESTVAVMNAIGLEANAVGNHEFDAGITELQRIGKGGCAPPQPQAVATSCAAAPYTGAKFPLLSANVVDSASGKPVLAPYVVKTFHGIRVGVIGAVTRTTPSIVIPSGISGLRFLDEADGINRAAKELRAMGVKAVIAVVHEGAELGTPQDRGDWNDTNCAALHGPIVDIARRLVPEISVIFSGHTHQGYRCQVDGRWIIQGTSYGRGVSVIDVVLDPETKTLLADRTRTINLPVFNDRSDPAVKERLIAAMPPEYARAERDAKPDAAIAVRVAAYSAAVAPTANRQVGTISARFGRTGPVDSALGRMVADSQLVQTRPPAAGGAQIAFMNAGGIRTDLDCNGTPPCPVTFGQVFSMQPFGNSLVVMTLTGAQLKALLEQQKKSATSEPNFLQPSEGFGYTWQSDAPAGDRVRDMRLNGEAVVFDRHYRVTVNNFMAEGGDGFSVLTDGTDRSGGGQDIDAVLAYLKSAPVHDPVTAARITLAP